MGNENIPHRLSGGKDRTVRDGVNASMQVSSEDLLKIIIPLSRAGDIATGFQVI